VRRESPQPFAALQRKVRNATRLRSALSTSLLPAHSCSKPLSSYRRDLMVGHLVNRFNTDDAIAESCISKTFLDLVLRLAGAKNQNRLRIANRRYHLVIVLVEMACEAPVARVFCTALTPRKADVLLNP
jgi:hypothetical protein